MCHVNISTWLIWTYAKRKRKTNPASQRLFIPLLQKTIIMPAKLSEVLRQRYLSNGSIKNHVTEQKLSCIVTNKNTCPDTFQIFSHNYAYNQTAIDTGLND